MIDAILRSVEFAAEAYIRGLSLAIIVLAFSLVLSCIWFRVRGKIDWNECKEIFKNGKPFKMLCEHLFAVTTVLGLISVVLLIK